MTAIGPIVWGTLPPPDAACGRFGEVSHSDHLQCAPRIAGPSRFRIRHRAGACDPVSLGHGRCDLMERLKRFDDVAFIDLPQYLDQYLRRIDEIPTEQVMSDYAFLRRFYFDVNDDREREEKFLARIQASNP